MCNKQKKQSPTMLVNCYEQLANHNKALNFDASNASILYVNQCETPISADFFSTNKTSTYKVPV